MTTTTKTTATTALSRCLTLTFTIAFAAIAAVGCKARQEMPVSAVQSEAVAHSKTLTAQDVAAWPEVVSGWGGARLRMPGLVVGITPDKSRAINDAAGDALKLRAKTKLLEQLQTRGPSFFLIAAVNPGKLPVFARPLVSSTLRSDLASEIEAFYGTDFAPWRSTGVLEAAMLASNDKSLAVHQSLGLPLPAEAGPAAPLSVAVVSKSGQVFGPFALTGAAATVERELDQIFGTLDRVLVD